MEANTVRTSGFEQAVRALDISFDKGRCVGYRVVVMRLGSKMYDGIAAGHHTFQ